MEKQRRRTVTVVAALVLAAALAVLASLVPARAHRPSRGLEPAETAARPSPALLSDAAGLPERESLRQPVIAREHPAENDERHDTQLVRGRIVDRHRAPLRSAVVCLHQGDAPRAGCDASAMTDAAGRFILSVLRDPRLPMHRLRLRVSHGEHAPAWFERVFVELRAELNLGDLTVQEGGVVSGRVVDVDGRALPEARLHLRPTRGRRSLPHHDESLPADALDAHGHFELRHVPAGIWTLVATASDRQEAIGPAFVVENGALTEVGDLALAPGFGLEGLVLDPAGSPVPRAAVDLRPERGQSFGTRTDESGSFRLDRLPPGPMRVTVRAEGYLRFESDGLDPSSAPPWLTVTLREGLELTGLVIDAASGLPVERFAARALRLGDLAAGAMLGSTRSPDELGRSSEHPGGRFALRGLEEGVYQIALQSPDHVPWRSEPLELRAGETREVTARLERGAVVRGRVSAAGGRAVAEARVELHRALDPDDGSPADVPEHSSLWARTDRAGAFALAQAPPGRYRLLASAAGFAPARSAVFDLGTDVTIELTLGELGAIRGVSGADCAPGTGVVLALPIGPGAGAGRGHSAALDPDGSYRIELPPGDYAVRAACDAGALWRAVAGSWLAGELAADVAVRGGETARYDPR